MNRYRNIWLIAKKDFVERVSTKAFKFGSLVMVLAVAASVVLPALLTNDDKPVRTVVIAGAAPAGLDSAITDLGAATGIDVRTTTAADAAAGEQLIRDDLASVVVVPGSQLITEMPVDSADPSDSSARLAASINDIASLYAGLGEAGLNETQTQAALSSPPLEYRSLETPPEISNSQRGTSTGVVIAAFVFLLIYTAWVVNSVIEEKTSRVVEILLSTLRARDLLTGKVLGTALVAAVQGLALLATVLIAQKAVEGSSSADIGLDAKGVAFAVVWIVLGYSVYAWLYAAAGALANRSQDAQSLTFPIQMPLLVSYFVAVTGAVGGSSAILTVMSFIPFTAPMAMLTRMTLGDAAGWEIAVSIGLMVVTALIVRQITVIIYTGAILRTGQRTKLSQAWRLARN